ncbi:hypothetical protein LSH36_669g00003 [Paralvinella palmiformis]|uniref:L-Fucosyltransferase n=1 Tax=Paralvinella palmiformis TaxID=53620 RepID=A0AAD9J3D2_9ANNE|nr:hypothetical protein LSH36_669g00003 [Paralvinella palmiformis]
MFTTRLFTSVVLVVLMYTGWYTSSYLKLRVRITDLFEKPIQYSRIGIRREPGNRFALSVIRQGRLGNAMWQYSALYGLANLTNRIPILSTEFQDLDEAFTLWISREWKDANTEDFYVHNQHDTEVPYNIEETVKTLRAKKQDVLLDGFFQHYKFFAHVSNEIRKQFTFRYYVKRQVAAFFRSFGFRNENVLKVGIHSRRDDLVQADWMKKGFGPPDVGYFRNAMKYFRTKYGRVHFVVCSDDLDWARRHLEGEDVTFVPNHSPEVDMAILTSCDHVIISNGTFSWWVGWLCTGITVRYKDIPEYNTLLYNMTLGEHWVPNDDYNHYVVIESV